MKIRDTESLKPPEIYRIYIWPYSISLRCQFFTIHVWYLNREIAKFKDARRFDLWSSNIRSNLWIFKHTNLSIFRFL